MDEVSKHKNTKGIYVIGSDEAIFTQKRTENMEVTNKKITIGPETDDQMMKNLSDWKGCKAKFDDKYNEKIMKNDEKFSSYDDTINEVVNRAYL